MNSSSEERIAEIKNLLAGHPQGLSINEISGRLHRHRNSVSRDLHALSLSGQVIQHAFGTTRVYSLAKRAPVSSILDHTSEMILTLDANDTVLSANLPLLDFLGCSADTLVRKSLHTLDHPLLAALSEHLRDDRRLDEHHAHAFSTFLDDRPFFFHLKRVPTVFESGASGLVLIIEDVTSQVCARESLERVELQYRAIIDAMHEMVVRILPDGSIIFANGVFWSFFSLSPDEGHHISFFSLVYPKDLEAFLSHLASLSPAHPDATISLQVTPAGGSPVWSRWTFQGLYDRDSRVLVYQGIGRDVSRDLETWKRDIAYMKEVAFLTSKSKEFLAMDPDKDIYRSIATHISEMTPDASAAVFEVDPDALTCVLKAISGGICQGEGAALDAETLQGSRSPLAGDIRRSAKVREALLSGSLINPGGFLFRQFLTPKEPEEGISPHKVIADMDAISAGLVGKGSLIGAVEVFTGKGQEGINPHLVEAYLSMASLALARWRSDRSLLASEERFSRIASANPHPISIIDSSGRYIFLSPRFTELFGYTLQDIPTGREWFMQAFPDLSEQKRARDTWKRDLTESLPGEVRPRQFRVRCKDGIFKEISFLPVTMSSGQQLVVYEDVTPRLEAVQTRNLLFDIFMSSHEGIFSATIDGRILSWNPAMERIYGYSSEELEGRDVRVLEPPELRGEISAILERIKRGEHIVNYETQRKRKDGKVIDVSLTISPIYMEGKTIMGASTIVRDITAQKCEERLRHAEMHYREHVGNINVGVYRSTGDPEGRFVWGNTSLLRILGYDTFEDLQGVPVSEMFVQAGGRADLIAELRRHGFVKNREITLRKADGSSIHVLVTALATFAPDGSISHINGIVEDITCQRVLEQKVAGLSGLRDEGPVLPPAPPRD
ncbi:MAG: sensory histidine kinase AtoS [Methanoregulaceae archaeon PtaB.Bin056]|nr:MAG: sensory histidine kinase AtoS [Methanoregulaceae archaeon PtaB.Bin056]